MRLCISSITACALTLQQVMGASIDLTTATSTSKIPRSSAAFGFEQIIQPNPSSQSTIGSNALNDRAVPSDQKSNVPGNNQYSNALLVATDPTHIRARVTYVYECPHRHHSTIQFIADIRYVDRQVHVSAQQNIDKMDGTTIRRGRDNILTSATNFYHHNCLPISDNLVCSYSYVGNLMARVEDVGRRRGIISVKAEDPSDAGHSKDIYIMEICGPRKPGPLRNSCLDQGRSSQICGLTGVYTDKI